MTFSLYYIVQIHDPIENTYILMAKIVFRMTRFLYDRKVDLLAVSNLGFSEQELSQRFMTN
jgi:hypothetical protein